MSPNTEPEQPTIGEPKPKPAPSRCGKSARKRTRKIKKTPKPSRSARGTVRP